MSRPLELVGMKFGRLTVLNRVPSTNLQSAWRCACECGKEVSVNGPKLKSGWTRSCGCLAVETARKNGKKSKGHKPRHRMAHTSTHNIWKEMRRRAKGKGPLRVRERYAGITVCERWSYQMEDMITEGGDHDVS